MKWVCESTPFSDVHALELLLIQARMTLQKYKDKMAAAVKESRHAKDGSKYLP
jgi:hypothetical protein